MIDLRIKTFLTLCKTKSYTKTAALLCITQPAVTQHIKYLEKQYNTALFYNKGKNLMLTKAGELLLKLSNEMYVNNRKIYTAISNITKDELIIKFGATLTVGEYIMPTIIKAYLTEYPTRNISMYTNNTASLLQMLLQGDIDFAIIEGYFNKSDYEYKLFSKENFIPICSYNKSYPKNVYLEELLNERLIIREPGSGTREILERVLNEQNISLNNFKNTIELGNMNAIKHLVSNEYGISFLYEAAVRKEIASKELKKIPLDFYIKREFNFVFLKNSLFKEQYFQFFDFAKSHYS